MPVDAGAGDAGDASASDAGPRDASGIESIDRAHGAIRPAIAISGANDPVCDAHPPTDSLNRIDPRIVQYVGGEEKP